MRTLGRWPIRSTRKIVLKGSAEMKHVLASLTIGACLLAPSAGAVFAGQPGTSAGVNCGTASAPVTPGQAAASPGAPFNEPAPVGTSPTGGKAGQVYAGSRPGAPTTASANAVSQYDVACLQVTTHQPP
jgi:hypothetical protein